jgi:hypothetical protein
METFSTIAHDGIQMLIVVYPDHSVTADWLATVGSENRFDKDNYNL